MNLSFLKKISFSRKYASQIRTSNPLSKKKDQNNPSFLDQDHTKEQLYLELKKAIESDRNAQDRYVATKTLYQRFPEQSLPFLSQRFLNDSNYHIRTVNFSERKRYNVNDLLNTIIATKYDKEQMVHEIVENHLVPFLLSWKEFTPFFHIYYDLHLHCFLMLQPTEKLCVYVCSRRKDPFSSLTAQKTLPIAQSITILEMPNIKECVKHLSYLFEHIFKVKKVQLLLSFLTAPPNTELPCYKLSVNEEEIVIYF